MICLGPEAQRGAAASSGAVGGREGEVEQQAELYRGDGAGGHRQGAGHVHPGGDRQRGQGGHAADGHGGRGGGGAVRGPGERGAVRQLRHHQPLVHTATALSWYKTNNNLDFSMALHVITISR